MNEEAAKEKYRNTANGQQSQASMTVIDYKTGGKKLRLDDCLEGLNLQMLLYVLAFKNGLSNITNKKPVISALLYFLYASFIIFS